MLLIPSDGKKIQSRSFQISTCPASFLRTTYRELKMAGTSVCVCETKEIPGTFRRREWTPRWRGTWWRRRVLISIKTAKHGNLQDIVTEFWKTSELLFWNDLKTPPPHIRLNPDEDRDWLLLYDAAVNQNTDTVNDLIYYGLFIHHKYYPLS